MKKAIAPIAACVAVLAAAPLALADGETVSAYGIGQIAATPTDRDNEASIAAAVADAQKRALPAAVEAAKVRATEVAAATNLTLGTVLSVEEQGPSPFALAPYAGVGGVITGPFNGKYCRTFRKPVFGRVDGKRKVVRRVDTRQCIVPPFAVAVVEITFRAAPRV